MHEAFSQAGTEFHGVNVHGEQQWALLLLNLIRWSTGLEETWLPNGEWHFFFVSTLQEPGQGGHVGIHGWFMEHIGSLCHLIGWAWPLGVIHTRRPRWWQPQRLFSLEDLKISL